MLIATIRKDLLLLARDRGALMSLFLLPVVFIAVFGFIFGGGGHREKVKLATFVEAPDDRSRMIAAGLIASEMFDSEPRDDAAQVAEASRSDGVIGLVIPAGVGPGHPVVLYIDPASPPQVRGPVEAAIRQIVSIAIKGGPPADEPSLIEVRAPPGKSVLDDVSGFQITVPGNAVLFGFFLALTVGLSFVEERRTGTWRRLLASPVNRRALLLAKLVPFFLVGLIQFAFLFGIGIVGFKMHVAGSPLALAVLAACVVLCATSLGLLIASFGGSEKQIGSIGSICILVMGLLGGCMVPRVVMPPVMKSIGLVVPHSWALDGFFDVIVRPGTSLADVAPQIGALLGFAVAFFTLGSYLFKFEK